MSKSLAIILLATFALTFTVPVVSGIYSIQQANAAVSGQNGKNGTAHCFEAALYHKGVVLDKLGNHTRAIEYYNKASAIKSATGGSTNMTASNTTSSTEIR
jgi:hypothetical protein